MTSSRARDAWAMALLVFLCLVWGAQQITVKIAIAQGIPPIQLAAMRSAIAAICVTAWIGLRDGPAALPATFRRDATLRPGLLIAAVFGTEFMALNLGLRLTTASRGVLFLYTAPFFVAIGAHWFLPGERLRLWPVLGMALAFCGVGLAFIDGLSRPGGSVAGDALCTLAAALWAATTIVIKASPALTRAPASRVLLYQLAGSVPLLLAGSVARGEPWVWPHASSLAWTALLYQSVVVSFASYLVWFWLVQHYPANRISAFTFLTPVFSIVAGAVVLHEPVGWPLVGGVAAVAAGLTLLNRKAA